MLPAAPGDRGEERRLREQLAAAAATTPALAVAVARRYLERARASRRSALRRPGARGARGLARRGDAPDEVLLMRATLQQYLHEFDAAVAQPARCCSRGRRARASRRPG